MIDWCRPRVTATRRPGNVSLLRPNKNKCRQFLFPESHDALLPAKSHGLRRTPLGRFRVSIHEAFLTRQTSYYALEEASVQPCTKCSEGCVCVGHRASTAMFRGKPLNQLMVMLTRQYSRTPVAPRPVYHDGHSQLVLEKKCRGGRLCCSLAVVRPLHHEIRVYEHRGGRPRGRVSFRS